MLPGIMEPVLWPVFSNISSNVTGNAQLAIQSLKPALNEKPPIWPHDNHPKIITYEVKFNPILPGDIINMKIGTGNKKVSVSYTAGYDLFKLAIVKNGVWEEINTFEFKINASNQNKIVIIAPSVVKTGEEVLLKMVALDDLNNRVLNYTGLYQLNISDNSAIHPQTVEFTTSDSGYLEIPITFNTDGFFNCSATLYNEQTPTSKNYSSNFSWVQNEPSHYIYWGDLHSHSQMSKDAVGFLPFEYAKYTSCLDFYANSEHIDGFGNNILGIDSLEWAYIKNKVTNFHEPYKFISILAYEATYKAEEGGNHIAYFNVLDEHIDDVPRISLEDSPEIWDFWEQLDELPNTVEALAWPHFTGRDQFLDTSNLVTLVGEDYYSPYRALYEMYSSHGQSEYYQPNHQLTRNHKAFWFVQDALAEGERIGFIAASDNHNAKPGQNGNGIGAVISNELSREALFNSFKNRLTYGSTGDRVIIDFKGNGHPMGSEIDLIEEAVPNFDILIHGTDTIEFIELMKWDFVNNNYGNDVHPDFEIAARWTPNNSMFVDTSFVDSTFTRNSVYYIRVKQHNRTGNVPSWAWSSPIWVNGETTLSSVIQNSFIEGMNIYPSLTTTTIPIAIVITSLQTTNVQLKVYDILAREVYQAEEEISKGNNLINLTTEPFSSGRYFISIEDQSGKKLAVKSFIVQ
ncbi:MAG: T9SS type A sorting domain-containing protein [Chitinophagales bacterium]